MPSHTIMNHKLAKALIEAGMHHFDLGGGVGGKNVHTSETSSYGPNPTGQAMGQGTQGATQTVLAPVSGLGHGIADAFTITNPYEANLAPTANTDFGSYISNAGSRSLNGYSRAQDIMGQQQQLANALLAQSRGQGGPNPAQAALNQNTGQNIQNQAALMASQRGAGANPALLARQAAMTGAGAQQAAIGQAATLQAEQELAAQTQAAQLQAMMGQQNIQEQAVNNQLFGTAAGAQNTQNSNLIQNYAMAQGINSQIAQNNANAENKTMGGFLGGVGGAIASLFAKGGKVHLPDHLHKMAMIYHPKTYADGGSVGESASVHIPNLMVPIESSKDGSDKESPNPLQQILEKTMGGGGEEGGGEALWAGPSGVEGGEAAAALAVAAGGGKIDGKAKVKGDSYKNDTVLSLLSPGEVVLPRHITMASDAPERAAAFVRHLQEKEERQGGYSKVVQSKKRGKAQS